MKVYIAQMNVVPGKPEENFKTMKAAVARAKKAGAEMVVIMTKMLEEVVTTSEYGDRLLPYYKQSGRIYITVFGYDITFCIRLQFGKYKKSVSFYQSG